MSLFGELARHILPGYMRRRWLRNVLETEPELVLLPALTSTAGLSIDVGANRGLFVGPLRPLSSEVVAFEPLPDMQRVLRQFYPKLRVEPVALSDTEGSAQIRLPIGNPSWATLEASNGLELARQKIVSIAVPLRRLDGYQFKNVSFIKVDVEGHEERVLAGAARTIGEWQPALLLEIEERHNPGGIGRILAWADRLHYQGYFLDQPVAALRKAADFSIERDQPRANVSQRGKAGRYINNFMFVPAARQEEFEARARALLDR